MLFRKEDHAANPPETWTAHKFGSRTWALLTNDGTILESFPTKAKAMEATRTGHLVKLYNDEGVWYADD